MTRRSRSPMAEPRRLHVTWNDLLPRERAYLGLAALGLLVLIVVDLLLP